MLSFPVEEGSPFSNHSDPVSTRQTLNALLARRILVMDGAMGTMIQSYRLDEAGFRGERFKDHPRDLKGANDLLSLVLDLNVHIAEYKVLTCDVVPGRRPRGRALTEFVEGYRRRSGVVHAEQHPGA